MCTFDGGSLKRGIRYGFEYQGGNGNLKGYFRPGYEPLRLNTALENWAMWLQVCVLWQMHVWGYYLAS